MFRVATALASLGLVFTLQVQALPIYYWRTLAISSSPGAQLVTLFCTACGSGQQAGKDIPLVAVLRDTLGSEDVSSHRLTDVWLLSYSHPTIAQKALAAIPFFYGNPSGGSGRVKRNDTSPLLDLSAPQHPAVANMERQILQWTALDTIGTPVRATSREYRTNQLDHERLHLEEANTYLINAPIGDGTNGLTRDERDFVMARLELRKKLLGGFVSSSRVASLGQQQTFEQERVRARNWELLRQCAEKTGLIFEPVRLAESEQQYGILWYPERARLEPAGGNLGPIWKLLGIKDPYSDSRLQNWTGPTKTMDGDQPMKLIPLGLYSLTYPRQPLLMVDFRDKRSFHRHDVTRKSIDEITSGVVGLSHFTNWYYFVASDLWNFLQERRGKANNRSDRLDSYSEFRVALALDHNLDPMLRQELNRRSEGLVSNPLESDPDKEMNAAVSRYSLLTVEAAGDGSRLEKRIADQRREELATFGASPRRAGIDLGLHALTFGSYTHREKKAADDNDQLALYRQATYHLTFLDTLVSAGTPPEVSYQSERIRTSVVELGKLMPEIRSPELRQHARLTLSALGKISSDDTLRASCDLESKKIADF